MVDTFTAPARRKSGLLLVASGVIIALIGLSSAQPARAATSATYTATETIPVPPASSFAGSSGGDGWAVALSQNAVYNVFHHDRTLEVACHLQADASRCWDTDSKTITDPSRPSDSFASSGHPGLWLDQNTGKLYAFATRYAGADAIGTGGVVCIDTTQPASNPDPFCGFTPLTGAGEATRNGISAISNGAAVGTRWYAFNYVDGAGSGAGASGTENTLLCFDLTTFQPCANQPFALSLTGSGTVSAGNEPPPGVAAIGGRVIVPITLTDTNQNRTDQLACFDPGTGGTCAGSWPVALSFSYDSSYGTPFPLLTASGSVAGLCLPANTGSGTDPCYTLDGASTPTPSNLNSVIAPTSGWNGPAFVLGPRVYVPDGNSDQVECYDYSTSAGCANFPKTFGGTLGLLYTVNPDPQRPECIWVNSDNGSGQIQNFDAYTGGGCGQGPIRVLASSLVVPTQPCTPSGYGSLQVLSPPRDSYSSGTVSFEDFDANPLGIPDQAIDATGSVSLDGLNLNANGLPEFLIALAGTQGSPGSVVVKLTWTGVYDPSCVKPGTTVSVPSPPASPAQARAPGAITGAPTVQAGPEAKFTGQVNPNASDTSAFFQYGLDLRYSKPGATGARYTNSTPAQAVGGDSANHTITASVSGLVPNALYHVRLVAINGIGTTFGRDVTFTTPKSPPPGPPRLGRKFNIAPVSGLVLIHTRGHVAPLTEAEQIGPGVVIDARAGAVKLVTATSQRNKTQHGIFSGAVFRIRQTAAGPTKGLATVMMVESAFQGAPSQAICKAHQRAGDVHAARASSKVIQLLRASAHGKFRTSGRYSAATVRGTVWSMTARCDGTLTRDITDSVVVTDFIRHRTIVLHPGQSYLAPGRQTPAAPHKHG